jgi:hypothetical protein
MNINSVGSSAPASHLKPISQRTNPYSNPTVQDQVHTSTHTLTLSRSLASLKEMTLPREEILQKFSKDIDRPISLHDDVIDHILNQL